MTIDREFSSFLDKLRPYLIEYLQEKGIDTAKNFNCLNPEHEDSDPSMTAIKANSCDYKAFCFGCNCALDIFDAYAILENKPRHGPGWMKEVVLPLAEKYDIQPPVHELSQEEQFCQDLYRVYNHVASMLNHNIDKMKDAPRNYIQEKEWTTETLEALDIGTITFDRLLERVDREEIEKFGLNRPDIFNENAVVFAIKDDKGRVIRFFSRLTGEKTRWQSTSSSKLLVDVWAKRGRLYLSDLIDRKLNYAILVEGQPDAVTLYQNGFQNVVATCGTTAYSEAHANLLSFAAITEIVVFFDNDEAGKKAVKKLLKQDFVKKSGVKYSIVTIPNEDTKDPDEYLRKYGKEQLEYLLDIRLTAFRYLLSQYEPSDEIEKVADEVLPYIASNKSEIARESMVRDFARYFKDEVSVSSILSDVRRLDDEVKNERESRQKLVVKAASSEAYDNPEQAIDAFREAVDRLEDIEKESDNGVGMEGSTLIKVQSNKQWEEQDRGDLPTAYKLLPGRMDNLSQKLSTSAWAAGQLIYVAAVENMGKSSWINDLAWQIASNKENQARVLLHTIDDSAEDLIRRMVCQAYGSPELTINMIANPQVFYEEEGVSHVYEMREEAYAKFIEVVSGGRIFIKDATDGTTISFAETQIKNIRRKYPNDNLVYFLDNFHNVTDWPMLDARQKFTRVSKKLKELATVHKCTIVSTVEYRKTDTSKEGTNEDLAEARGLKYDAKFIGHIFSDVHAKGEEEARWVHKYKDKILPRVYMKIGKSKVGDFKGHLYFDFYPASGLFFSVSPLKAKMDYEKRVAELKGEEAEDGEEG